MKRLLIATHNPAKLEELKEGAKPLIDHGVEVVTLKYLNVKGEPKETGKTFGENALIKALFYARLTGLPTIADDGGMMIEAFCGAPGVKSRRWIGHAANDKELIAYTLRKMRDVPQEKRTAHLRTCICFYEPQSKSGLCEKEEIKGYVAKKISGNPSHGYPYRALFVVDEFNKYYDELTPRQHHQINHRLKAMRRLTAKIIANFLCAKPLS
jgi:XTP/dITP diphosphohydrolase